MADYLRAGIGTTAAGVPVLFATINPVILAALAGTAGLFMILGLRTAVRHASRVELTADAIALIRPGLREARINWSRLSGFDLRYYSTRRDRGDGWMHAKLTGKTGPSERTHTLKLDSSIEGFAEIVACATAAAERNAIALDAHSRSNLLALGLEVSTADGEATAPLGEGAAR
ncbi:MAG: hypothetical protein QNJ92_07365 [Alphaproteobacteria bacterium]|nr:hypothetical protein [Alphaproteobacteria bacterium]